MEPQNTIFVSEVDVLMFCTSYVLTILTEFTKE